MSASKPPSQRRSYTIISLEDIATDAFHQAHPSVFVSKWIAYVNTSAGQSVQQMLYVRNTTRNMCY